MSEIKLTIEIPRLDEFLSAVNKLHGGVVEQAVQTPVQVPAQTPVQVPTQTPVQTSVPSYSIEQLSLAAAPLMNTPEGIAKLQEIIAGYNIASLQDLPVTLYGDFASKIRALGAVI